MYTSRHEDFLCCCEATDDSGGFVVFTTKSNLVTLCNADVITMDGTFRVCPKFFHQLYTIHGYLNEHYIPLVHCLLSHKAMATYVRMLNTIQSNCAAINLCFSPQDAVVDFEISMLAAVQTVIPNTSVHCCRFHLGQAWWRHMNSIGLGQIYKDKSSDASRWLRLFSGLSLLPPNEVSDAFTDDTMPDAPASDTVC